jgi:hypothetical protein
VIYQTFSVFIVRVSDSRKMKKCKDIQKCEENAGLTVKETKFIFDAAVLSNDWGRQPKKYDTGCYEQQKRYLKNARTIVDRWAKAGTHEYAFDFLSSSQTGVLLIRRFNLWCKGRPQPEEQQDLVDEGQVDNDASLSVESDSEWEDVPTEDETQARSEQDCRVLEEASSSMNGDSDGTSSNINCDGTSSNINSDVSPNNPPVTTPNSEDTDAQYVEDDKKFRPEFEVEEDTLWKNLTFLQVS